MVITPDTGIIHMASAVGTPVVGLYVGGQAAAEWRPFGVPYRVVTSPEDLSVAAIPPAEVMQGFEQLVLEMASVEMPNTE
jgi:ADP-heptose:LPS heptosyltransferase